MDTEEPIADGDEMPTDETTLRRRFRNEILGMCQLLQATRHWSFQGRDAFSAWLDNFEADDQWLAAILLDKLSVINTEHESACLRQSLSEWLLSEARRHGPFHSLAEKEVSLRQLIRETRFTPVLGESPGPSDSGNSISRVVRYMLKLSSSQVVSLEDAVSHAESGGHVVLVDDCVGSGSQFSSTWERTAPSASFKSLYASGSGTHISLVGTVGSSETIAKIRALGISCHFAYLLESDDRVEHAECEAHYPITESSILRGLIGTLLAKYSTSLGDDPIVRRFHSTEEHALGFQKLGYTIAIPRQFPDWTLPVFWARAKGWNRLALDGGV